MLQIPGHKSSPKRDLKIFIIFITSLILISIPFLYSSNLDYKRLNKEGVKTVGCIEKITTYKRMNYYHYYFEVNDQGYNSILQRIQSNNLDNFEVGRCDTLVYLIDSP